MGTEIVIGILLAAVVWYLIDRAQLWNARRKKNKEGS